MTLEFDLKKALKKFYDVEIDPSVEISTNKQFGDYSTNVAMRVAKLVNKNPMQVAEELASQLECGLEIAKPGFINFFVDKDQFAKITLEKALANELIDSAPKMKKIIVEHTSVNPNKAMHVGHVRNAILGDSIANLLKRQGYKVEIHNYIDDTGVQVADTVNGLMHLGMKQVDGQKFDDFCWDVYTKINKEYEVQPSLLETRAGILHEIEKGTGEIALFAAKTVEQVVACHLETMSNLGIDYDVLVYESDIIKFGFWEHAFSLLKKSRNFVLEPEGDNKDCWVLKYDSSEFGDKVFVRSDGTKVYTAKDVAYHLWKFGILGKDFLFKQFSPETSVYRTSMGGVANSEFGKADAIVNVIDERQKYPQEMVKHALHSLSYTQQADAYSHIAYGVVSLSPETAQALGVDISGGKSTYAMSGRKGIGVKVSDLLALLEKEIEGIQNKSVENAITAKGIAVGALKQYMLKNNPESPVLFDYKQALQLTGNTGPYLQYSHARAFSILDKVAVFKETATKSTELTETEYELVKQITNWPDILARATKDFNISTIAEYAFELSKSFHAFYEHNNVLKSEGVEKDFRLTLVKAYTLVIKDVLGVLGIKAPDRM